MKLKKLLAIAGLYFIIGLMQQAYAQFCSFGSTSGHIAGALGRGDPVLSVYQIYQGMTNQPTGVVKGSVEINCSGRTEFKFETSRGTPTLNRWTGTLGSDPRNAASYSLNVTSSIGNCNRSVTYNARNSSMSAVSDCAAITGDVTYTVTYTVPTPMKMYSDVENAYGGPMGSVPLVLYKYTVGGVVGGAQLGLVPRIDECTNPNSFLVTVDRDEIDLSVITGQTKHESFNINIAKRNPNSSLCKRPVNPRIQMTTLRADSLGVINLGNGYNLTLTDWNNRQVRYGIYTEIPTMTTSKNLQYRVKLAPRGGTQIKEGEFNQVIRYGIEFR